MNRELKVPAALAIMLVGFAAMVCWCGKPQDAANTDTALEDFSDIDAEIQDRPHTPHLTGLDSEPGAVSLGQDAQAAAAGASTDEGEWLSWLQSAGDAKTKSVSRAAPESHTQPARDRDLISSRPAEGSVSLGRADDELDLEDEVEASESGALDGQGRDTAVPAPIRSVAPPAENPQDRWRENDGWDVVPPSQSARPQEIQQRTYVIQPGDTLSRIAAKLLGGSHRAQELFDANRDVLADPNQLSVGTEIVIPQRRVAPPEPVVKPDGPVAESPEVNFAERSDSGGSMFVPVSSSPLRNPIRELGNSTAQKPDQPSAPRQYTVQRGDTLERISVDVCGTRTKALDIFRQNADLLSTPDAIREGMVLQLP